MSDIHGNSFALEAMLEVAKKEKVEKLLILGDLVGYYYHPKKVVELIADWEHHLIRGNHEDILAGILSGDILEEEIRLKYGSGHRKAIEQLNEPQKQLLLTAPTQMQVEYDGIKILMCHGSPWQSDFYLYPNTVKQVFNKCDYYDVDLIFVGHSHYSFVYKLNKGMLINCGSVGQSRNLGAHASWALLDTDNGAVQLRLTPYNVQPLLAEVDNIDPDVPYLKDILIRNVNG
jgi:putative phosphoesterase